MFRSFGIPELLLVLLIALLIFGATRVPQIGEALGKAIRNFRKGVSGEEDKKKDQVSASSTEKSNATKEDKL
jgi:sec-independent protein translocase protein TatA